MAMKIFVNGTFDLVHRGHLELLKYAKNLGGYLLVAIDTDERVRDLKGKSRPIIDHFDRCFHLQSLRYVDQVALFDSDQELEQIIREYQPDIMVKGSDYRNKPIIGSQYCKQILFFDRINDYATTKTIQAIVDR